MNLKYNRVRSVLRIFHYYFIIISPALPMSRDFTTFLLFAGLHRAKPFKKILHIRIKGSLELHIPL
jgi:hypothetical protein